MTCDCIAVKLRIRLVSVILLSTGTVVLLLDVALTRLPEQQWWPGWLAIGDWLGQWWQLLLAVGLAASAIALVKLGATRSPVATPTSLRWESQPGHLAMVARTTVASGDTPAAKRRWNWTAITSVVTAFTALAALTFTAQSLSATREQISLSEQGQITDRYTKAIDQLGTQGAEHLQTRLGGIYALERLARDSPRDQATIIEILSAFIRSALPTATRRPDGGTTCPDATDLQVDVLAALTVLERRDHNQDHGARTDLHGVCLTAAPLDSVDLTGAVFSGADLARTEFYSTNLTGADFNGAHLDGANFDGVDLSGAILHSTDLRSAKFAFARLYSADVSDAHLNDADLTNVYGIGTHLASADLSGADLSYAHLNVADLTHACLDGANLSDANLNGASLDDVAHDSKTITGGATKDGTSGAWW